MEDRFTSFAFVITKRDGTAIDLSDEAPQGTEEQPEEAVEQPEEGDRQAIRPPTG